MEEPHPQWWANLPADLVMRMIEAEEAEAPTTTDRLIRRLAEELDGIKGCPR